MNFNKNLNAQTKQLILDAPRNRGIKFRDLVISKILAKLSPKILSNMIDLASNSFSSSVVRQKTFTTHMPQVAEG